MPQSPLSKAVNTEFPRHPSTLGPGFVKTPVIDVKAPLLEIEENECGNDTIWQLVHLLECEGSRASSSAKTAIAASSMYVVIKRIEVG